MDFGTIFDPKSLQHGLKNIKKKIFDLNKYSNVKIYYHLSYFQCLSLISNSNFIISDSGGIQEEAPSFKK